jgi:hypothetical protein
MATFETKCGSCKPYNGVTKVLLTVDPQTPGVTEYLLLNLGPERIDFAEGDTVEVTLRNLTAAGALAV